MYYLTLNDVSYPITSERISAMFQAFNSHPFDRPVLIVSKATIVLRKQVSRQGAISHLDVKVIINSAKAKFIPILNNTQQVYSRMVERNKYFTLA